MIQCKHTRQVELEWDQAKWKTMHQSKHNQWHYSIKSKWIQNEQPMNINHMSMMENDIYTRHSIKAN